MNTYSESITVVKDAIPSCLHNYIQEIILSNTFPWYYCNSIAGYDPDVMNEVGFASVIIAPSQVDLLSSILYITAKQQNITIKNILRIRAGMFLRSSSKQVHTPHIDYDVPHLSMLYYLIDSDGPTYFYYNNGNIIKTVDPVKGTAVIFDGRIKHSSSTPVNHNQRVVINFNFNFHET